MKSRKLTFVLMAGLPGAGKSTLAGALARELRWHVIDKDRHKEVLLAQGLDEEIAGHAAYELAFATARTELSQLQTPVILDSAALHLFILEKAREIVSSVPEVQLKTIFCVADRNLRNLRLRQRPAQITNIRVDPETIIDYMRYFDHLPSDKLILFTHASLEECLAKAIAYLTS